MQRFLKSWWVRIGIVLLVLGTGPLATTMVAAKLGLTADPNPNPVYFGILAGFTFWPSLALIAVGIWRVRQIPRATPNSRGDR